MPTPRGFGIESPGAGKHGRRGSRRRTVLMLAWMAALAGADGADAMEKVVQLTSSEAACSYLSPQLAGNGEWLAAVSLCSRGSEPAHQIVRIEVASREIQTLTPPDFQSFAPTLSGDGQRIVFVSNADLVPGENPHHLEQVYLFDGATHRYIQLTHIGVADTHRTVNGARISGNGDTVVFVSDGDLQPGQNPDGNLELFVFDVPSGRLLQATDTRAPAKHYWPVVSHDGQTVVFLGLHPPFGERPFAGVYAWNRRSGTVQRLLETLYPDAGAFTELVMASHRSRLAFSGRYDLVGENPDRNIELFTFDMESGIARQVTHTMGCTSAHQVLSADGRDLFFVSNCRFGRLNEDRDPNLFRMRVDSGEVVQLTDSGTSATIEPLTVDRSGRRVAVSIGAELNGMVNPDGLLQVALLSLPPTEPAAEVPLRLASVEDLSGFLVSRHNPETLFLFGRQLGIMKSHDGGRFWKLASFGLGEESVTCLVEHRSQADVLLAGTLTSGVYKTTDGGRLWIQANAGLTDRRILDLAVDPISPDVVYAATPSGLYRSRDRGGYWEFVSDRVTFQADGRGASPVDHASRSAGAAGRRALVSGAGGAVRLLGLGQAGLFLLNGKETEWVHVKTPLSPQWVVIGAKGTPWMIGTSRGIYRADRFDGDWVEVSGLPEGPIPAITISGDGIVYAAAQGKVYQSLDQGATWSRVADLEAVSQLVPTTSASHVLIAALEDGRLQISRDGGVHWSPLKIPPPSPEGLQSVLIRPAP